MSSENVADKDAENTSTTQVVEDTHVENSLSESIIDDKPTVDTGASSDPPKSKNQMKREIRWAKQEEKKVDKRNAQKERKKQRKADELKSLEGGDKVVRLFERDENGLVLNPDHKFKYMQRHPKEKLMELTSKPSIPRLVIDCDFESEMQPKEVYSLVKQLAHCYGGNSRAVQPVKLFVTGITPGSQTDEGLKRFAGVEDWVWERRSESYLDVFGGEMDSVVYLTAESDNTLDEVDPNTTYVIGGIVDHNRLKSLAHNKATGKKVRTARLPIDQFMESGARTVLTIVNVAELMIARQSMSWRDAFVSMLPVRWQWKEKDSEGTQKSQDQ